MTAPIVLSANGRRIELHTADVLDWAAAYDGAPFHAVLTDPPYLAQGQRAGNRYTYSLCRERHVELLELLAQVQRMVALSGYQSELYQQVLVGWQRIELRAHCYASTAGRTRGNRNGSSRPRTDVLWLNPAASQAVSGRSNLSFELEAEEND